jgi:hypothetical protein
VGHSSALRNDEVEVAVIERNPVSDGSIGQDEVADFIEDIQDCRPKSGVQWLENYLASVKTIYAFQHLQGSKQKKAAMRSTRCAQHFGSAETRLCRPTEKGSRMRMATTSSGSFPIRFQALEDGRASGRRLASFLDGSGRSRSSGCFPEGSVPDDLTSVLGSSS